MGTSRYTATLINKTINKSRRKKSKVKTLEKILFDHDHDDQRCII